MRPFLRKLIPDDLHLPYRAARHQLRFGKDTGLEFALSKCNGAGTAIDVGANIGIFTFRLARHFRKVIAFEPNHQISGQLAAWIDSPRCQASVTLNSFGLGDTEGEFSLYAPRSDDGKFLDAFASLEPHDGYELYIDRAQIRRLDDFHLDDVAFIKIDVEGLEKQTLAGAEQTIRADRPVMYIEIEARHTSRDRFYAVTQSVIESGYDCFFVENGEIRDFSEFSLDRHQRPETSSNEKLYSNDFIFLPRTT